MVKKGLLLLLPSIAYFFGSWAFFSIVTTAADADLRFVLIIFAMPLAFLVFTVIVQCFLRRLTGLRISYFFHLSVGAFIGISCFLLSVDGFGQFCKSDSFAQFLSQFAIPIVGAVFAGVEALGFHAVSQALQPLGKEDNN